MTKKHLVLGLQFLFQFQVQVHDRYVLSVNSNLDLFAHLKQNQQQSLLLQDYTRVE